MLLLAAAFTLKTANGTDVLFPAHDRKATLVYVVLAECPIAQKFSPEMARLAKVYQAKGIRFLMAFADAEPAAMRTQMKQFGLNFPAAKADRRLIGLLKAVSVPTAALITADGRVPYVGRIDDRFPSLGVQRKPRRADLKIALDQFLAGKPVSPRRTDVVGCNLPNP